MSKSNLPVIVVDLPMPPTTNTIWRQGRNRAGKVIHHKSAAYTKWIKAASDQVLLQRVGKGWHTILGAFVITLTLCRKKLRKNADMDNRIKATMDFCQAIGFVENDKHCQRIVIEFGEAPLGARVTLEPSDFVT